MSWQNVGLTRLHNKDGQNDGCILVMLDKNAATVYLKRWFKADKNRMAAQKLKILIDKKKGSDLNDGIIKDARLSLAGLGRDLFEGLHKALNALSSSSSNLITKTASIYLAYTEKTINYICL
jgi:hypothetical protein